MPSHQYRGYTIERVEAVQVGHKTERSASARAGIGTSRKVRGYHVRMELGYRKWAGTLREARAYIDSYLGREDA
jgi:hypothetical protein